MIQLLRRLKAATKYSCAGVAWAFFYEFAFRAQTLLVLALLGAAIVVVQKPLDLLILLFPFILALAFELVNTAIEQTINELGKGAIRPAFRVAKDCGSAAVFVLLLWGGMTWVCYLLERIA